MTRLGLFRTVLCATSAIAGVPPSKANTISYSLVAESGEAVGAGTLVGINGDPTENNLGQVAFTGTLSLGGSTGSALLLASPSAGGGYAVSSLGFPPSSRSYLFPQINDSGNVIVQELVPGAPPAFIIRQWSTGTSKIVASTTDHVFSAVLTPTVSNTGGVSYVGLSGGGATDNLVSNPTGTRGADTNIGILSGGGFRPLRADNGDTIVHTGNAGSDSIRVFGPSGTSTIASASAFSTLGSVPGISDDGRVVAFYGVDSSGVPGIFVQRTDVPGAVPVEAIKQGDPLIVPATNDKGGVVVAPPDTRTLASITPNSRIAIQSIDSPLGMQYRVVFLGADAAPDGSSHSSVYTFRVDADQLKTHPVSATAYGLSAISVAGTSINALIGAGSTTFKINPTSYSISDPAGSRGGVAFQIVQAGGVTDIVNAQVSNFTAYKQVADGSSQNNWYNKSINPTDPTARNFSASGCVITSLAEVVTIFGKDYTPLQMAQLLRGAPVEGVSFTENADLMTRGNPKIAKSHGGDIALDPTRPIKIGDNSYLTVTSRGSNFSTIVSELEAGRPVLLTVPSEGAETPGAVSTTNHAIVAFGIRAGAGPTPTASDILVSDPGYITYYKGLYGSEYGPGEVTAPVTLQDVFKRINDTQSKFTYSVKDWYDDGKFEVRATGATQLVTAPKKSALDTFFNISSGPIADRPISYLYVASPVEVAFTSPITGKRYVSSASIEKPGDILLSKLYPYIADSSSEDGTSVEPDTPFPPYELSFDESFGLDPFSLDIFGIGDGSFDISYFDAGLGEFVPSTVSGTIVAGEEENFTFGSGVPEVPTTIMFGIGITVLLSWPPLWKRRRTTAS